MIGHDNEIITSRNATNLPWVIPGTYITKGDMQLGYRYVYEIFN